MSDSGAERPTTFPRDAVLTVEQVAAWLDRSKSTVYRLGIKRTPTGHILAAWVYEWLEAQAA